MAAAQQAESQITDMNYHRPEPEDELASGKEESTIDETGTTDIGQQAVVNAVPKVGRNEPCPCGSGKKYKHCHGRLD